MLREKGHAAAKVCRSVASGVCGFVARRDGLPTNPVRDVGNLERSETIRARTLTLEESRRWLSQLDVNPYAVCKDLPDLVRFLLGTGVRIGEARGGVTWADVDLDQRLVHICRTIVRVKGHGLVAKSTRGRSGLRVLRIPSWLADVLAKRRPDDGVGQVPVFADAHGGWRDGTTSNVTFGSCERGPSSSGWCRTRTARRWRRRLIRTA